MGEERKSPSDIVIVTRSGVHSEYYLGITVDLHAYQRPSIL